jgi:hypothetical protein
MKIDEIRAFFENRELPKGSIELTSGERVLDVGKMVESHIETLVANKGNRTFLPYYNRLITVINHIKNTEQ